MQFDPSEELNFDFFKKNKLEIWYSANKVSIAKILGRDLSRAVTKICEKGRLKGAETSINGGVRMLQQLLRDEFAVSNYFWKSYSLEAHTFVSEQEGPTGCDIIFTYEVFPHGKGEPFISKCIPVQAKIATIKTVGAVEHLYCKDPHLKDQLININKICPDNGYLLMYTEHDAYVALAADALNAMGNTSTTMLLKKSLAKKCGLVAELLAICTGGDTELSPDKLGIKRENNGDFDIEAYVEKFTSEAEKKTGVRASKKISKEEKAAKKKEIKANSNSVAVVTLKTTKKK